MVELWPMKITRISARLPREPITVLNSVAGVSSRFEQFCETLDEIARVPRQTRYPIFVDEGLQGMEDLITHSA